jgi:hypothetical protein
MAEYTMIKEPEIQASHVDKNVQIVDKEDSVGDLELQDFNSDIK